jgi:hypothetical protein
VSSGAELLLVMKAKNLASHEVDKLHGSLRNVEGSAGRVSGKLASLGATALKVGAVGIAGLVGALGFAAHAAAEEQVGIARMNAALKANDKHWKGNTDAIEKTIAKREALGFADDDLRESLTKLVARTHDSDRALRLQSTAMDLARLKGISVAEASDLLTKGMGGATKVLKDLGIVLPKTATAQERLAAIQKVAAGQAQAYGKTAAGAQEAFQVAIGDTVEDLGAGLLPVMTTVFTWLRTDALPAVKRIAGAISEWIDRNRPLIDQIAAFVGGALKTLITKLGEVVTWIGSIVSAISKNKDAMNVLTTIASAIASAFGAAWNAVSTLLGWLGKVVSWITNNKTAVAAFQTTWTVIQGVLGAVADALHTIIDLAGKALDALSHINTPDAKFAGQSYAEAHGLGKHAAGGWVGLHGPEVGLLGEHGPEYIIPNHDLGRGGGVPVSIPIVIDGRELARVVDERLYYKLSAAPVQPRQV